MAERTALSISIQQVSLPLSTLFVMRYIKWRSGQGSRCWIFSMIIISRDTWADRHTSHKYKWYAKRQHKIRTSQDRANMQVQVGPEAVVFVSVRWKTSSYSNASWTSIDLAGSCFRDPLEWIIRRTCCHELCPCTILWHSWMQVEWLDTICSLNSRLGNNSSSNLTVVFVKLNGRV